MNKSDIYRWLHEQGVAFEITEHEAVYNMEEVAAVALSYPEWIARNLFVRDDKKRSYYLLAVKGEKRIDLKAFRRQCGLRPLSFASAEELLAIMGLQPGMVTPLGILNDREKRVHLYIDAEFRGNKIGVHPNDNTATIWLQADALLELITKHGNAAEFVEMKA